jgi:hypothetical protein
MEPTIGLEPLTCHCEFVAASGSSLTPFILNNKIESEFVPTHLILQRWDSNWALVSWSGTDEG